MDRIQSTASFTRIYSVENCSTWPAQHVIAIEGQRRAQIISKRLRKLFPGTCFCYREDGAFENPDCHPSIRDAARSLEMVRSVQEEMTRDPDNKDDLPKWRIFFYDNRDTVHGCWQVSCYLDHDLDVIRRCEDDPNLRGETHVFTEQPSTTLLSIMLKTFAEQDRQSLSAPAMEPEDEVRNESA